MTMPFVAGKVAIGSQGECWRPLTALRSPSRRACALAAALCLAPAAHAADFYAGKTIEMIVGSDVGGGYDTYTRVIARHIGRHLPGHPTVLVKNMPGAGSG